jgi:hypothetical protein
MSLFKPRSDAVTTRTLIARVGGRFRPDAMYGPPWIRIDPPRTSDSIPNQKTPILNSMAASVSAMTPNQNPAALA